MKAPKREPYGVPQELYPHLKPGTKVTIGGVRGVVISPRDAENADYIVCAPVTIPLIIADNATGPCSGCSRTLQFRANAPKKPPRLCIPCLALRVMATAGRA